MLPFAEYIKLNGTGTTSLVSNGATTNQDFYVGAKAYDVHIKTLVVEIADAGAQPAQFGALAALTNGLEFYYFNQSIGQYTIESGIKSNYDMLTLANFNPAFGTAADTFLITNAIGTSEVYVGVIDLARIFGLPWGVLLRANSTDRLGFIVKDNLTGVDQMTVKSYGARLLS